MSRPKYSKDQKEFIEKWGARAELEFDTSRILMSPTSGERISALDSAKIRQAAIEEIEKLKKCKSI